MKITLWSFAHDCLPCGHQLQKWHVPASPTCVFCNQYKTVEHALLFCQFAHDVWQQVKTVFIVHLCRSCFTSSRTWTLDFLGRCSKVEATVVIVALWHIWDARNKAWEGERLMHPNSVMSKIKAYVDMILLHLYKPDVSERCETSSSTLKWSPPPVGSVLINVDVALFASSRQMGTGIVIRDHNGSCLAACRKTFEEVIVPKIAEAQAMRHALVFAQEEDFTNIVVGSDRLLVVQRVNFSTTDRSFVVW
jgi:hypothetical protein